MNSWNQFWFRPVDPIALHGVRVLTGVLLLYWLVSFAGNQAAFFGLEGWVDQTAIREMSRLGPEQFSTPFTWSLLYIAPNGTVLTGMYIASIAIVALFTLGIATRITGVLTWVVVASFTANPALAYGGDSLLLILSLYLMVGYLFLDLGLFFSGESYPGAGLLLGAGKLFGKAKSWDSIPSVAANVALRLLQVHLAIAIFVSGMHKLQSGVWWAGLSLWFPLNQPFEITYNEILEKYPHGSGADSIMIPLSLACYGLLVWQISFPFLMWRPTWRPILLTGAALGWLGSVFLFQLPIFGPGLFIGCLAFVPSSTWRRWVGAFARAKQESRQASLAESKVISAASETRANVAAG